MPESQQQSQERSTIDLLGVTVGAVDTEGLRDQIIGFATQDTMRTVLYVNADCMLLANKDQKYRKALNGADLVYADGIGVVYAAKLWGHSLPGRSTGADFMPDFCRTFAEKGLRLYFLGASDGVAKKAAEKLRHQVPDLKIVGTHHGYFSPEQKGQVISRINAAKPDIVVVGFGAPKQEIWIHENAHLFDTVVLWGVGGLFDFLSGRTKRGPQWLLDHGFEWLCRLIVEPRRLWRRYLLGNATFVFYVLRRRLQDFLKTVF